MLQTTTELLTNILYRAHELRILTDPITGSERLDAALIYLNRAYYALALGGREFMPAGSGQYPQNWWWLRKSTPGILTLEAVATAGTVAVTQRSTTITFSSPPAASVAGRYFQTGTWADVFRIASHTAASATAVLDAEYTGITAAALGYKVMALEYPLATDVLRILAPMRVHQSTGSYWHENDNKIHQRDLVAMEHEYPLYRMQSGMPSNFAMVGESRVRFNRYGGSTSTELFRVEYEYVLRPPVLTNAASEEPLVPLQHRSILVDLALYYLMIDKNDDRAQVFANDGRGGLTTMMIEQSARLAMPDGMYGKLMPRSPRGRRAGVWRTTGGRLLTW